jgi:uracil-DNA glycosylase
VGGEPEVREFLTTVIQARLEAKNSKMMLFLGMETARWILTEEQTAKISNGQTNVFNEIVGLVIPSLAEMIEDPQNKRKAWNIIRPLSAHKKPHLGDASD